MSSLPEAKDHPIKRVRRAFKELPKISGMRWLSGAKQFAQWLGCSESLIRNVETSPAKLSEKLASKIEAKTGVSAEWLMSETDANDPIIDVRGEEWSPKWIDVFSAHPDLGLLYRICPSLLPRVIAKLVEAELRTDFFEGKRGPSVAILQRLFRKGAFKDNQFQKHLDYAIREDDVFREKYLDCLSRALDDFTEEDTGREHDLHLLKELEPVPPPDSRIAKLVEDRLEPTE